MWTNVSTCQIQDKEVTPSQLLYLINNLLFLCPLSLFLNGHVYTIHIYMKQMGPMVHVTEKGDNSQKMFGKYEWYMYYSGKDHRYCHKVCVQRIKQISDF